jgi:hypothetical protein
VVRVEPYWGRREIDIFGFKQGRVDLILDWVQNWEVGRRSEIANMGFLGCESCLVGPFWGCEQGRSLGLKQGGRFEFGGGDVEILYWGLRGVIRA